MKVKGNMKRPKQRKTDKQTHSSSPDRSLKFVEFLRRLDDLSEFVHQDVCSEVEPNIPVVSHLLQAALPTKQRAESHTWMNNSSVNNILKNTSINTDGSSRWQ